MTNTTFKNAKGKVANMAIEMCAHASKSKLYMLQASFEKTCAGNRPGPIKHYVKSARREWHEYLKCKRAMIAFIIEPIQEDAT